MIISLIFLFSEIIITSFSPSQTLPCPSNPNPCLLLNSRPLFLCYIYTYVCMYVYVFLNTSCSANTCVQIQAQLGYMIKPWNQKHIFVFLYFCDFKVCTVLSPSLQKYTTYILAEAQKTARIQLLMYTLYLKYIQCSFINANTFTLETKNLKQV